MFAKSVFEVEFEFKLLFGTFEEDGPLSIKLVDSARLFVLFDMNAAAMAAPAAAHLL